MKKNTRQPGNDNMDYVATVSHDLKSPLSGILGFIELIKMDLADCDVPEDVMENLDIIAGISNDMLVLIHNMITAVRIEAGQEPISPARLDRGDLRVRAHALEETFSHEARSKRVDFSVRVHSLPEYVEWDILKVRYFAINNIISNALKFAGEGGVIKVDIRVNDAGMVEIAIADNGCGIPLDERPHVFEKFNQASSTKRNFSGSGLGLFNAAQIVRAHHGSIEIQDGLEGRGVTFLLKLPPVPFEYVERRSLSIPSIRPDMSVNQAA